MHDVVYKGWWIRPATWPLPGSGFGTKVTIRSLDDQAAVTRFAWLPGHWATREEARRSAIEAGMRLIDGLGVDDAAGG